MNLQFIKNLGQGGFGKVDLVFDSDSSNNQIYAQKFFNSQQTQLYDNFRRRFIREINVQSQFNHPNIVPVIDTNLTSHPPYFLMPVANSTLTEDMNQPGFIPNNALFDILQGLEEIHHKGYSHRDLKPDNILRFDDGNGTSTYAISDFGLIDNGRDMTTLTATGDAGGTPYYAAPELFQDLSRATHLCDIYSFGAILHDIYATSRRTPGETLSAPGPIGNIISKCTQRLPMRRYQSISEIRQDLYSALNSNYTQTAENYRITEILSQPLPLNNDLWDEIFFVLEEVRNNNSKLHEIFKLIKYEHITDLAQNQGLPLLTSFTEIFTNFIINYAFDFNYCDILADKLLTLFTYSRNLFNDISLQASILLALLLLGVGHNRWYVERKFATLASASLDERVVDRLIFEANDKEICLQDKIEHLLWSISLKLNSLHPRFSDYVQLR
jgi:non-specific serine/threonine protein kinase